MKKIGVLILFIVLLTGCTTKDAKTTPSSKQETDDIKEEQVEIVKEQISEEENLFSQSSSQQLLTTIEQIDEEISTWEDSNKVKENENTLKNTFVTLVDFIFYDGTISGTTFSELTDDMKVKLLDLLNKIDQKIESISPNYKENLSQATNKAYISIKEKTSSLKESILNKYRETVGEEEYQNTKEALEEDKNRLEEAYRPYIEKSKEIVESATEKGKGIYENAKDKISTWYQEWKESD